MGRFRELGREKPWAQGCLIAVAGVVLGVSGCFGFLLTLNFSGGPTSKLSEALGLICGAGFFAGALALPVGFVWWIVGLVKVNSRRAAAAAPPPPAGPGDGA